MLLRNNQTNDTATRDRFVADLSKRFPTEDKGALKWILNVEISRDRARRVRTVHRRGRDPRVERHRRRRLGRGRGGGRAVVQRRGVARDEAALGDARAARLGCVPGARLRCGQRFPSGRSVRSNYFEVCSATALSLASSSPGNALDCALKL